MAAFQLVSVPSSLAAPPAASSDTGSSAISADASPSENAMPASARSLQPGLAAVAPAALHAPGAAAMPQITTEPGRQLAPLQNNVAAARGPAQRADSSHGYASPATSNGQPQSLPVTNATHALSPMPGLAEAASSANAKPSSPGSHHTATAVPPVGSSAAAGAQTTPDTAPGAGSHPQSQSGSTSEETVSNQKFSAPAHPEAGSLPYATAVPAGTLLSATPPVTGTAALSSAAASSSLAENGPANLSRQDEAEPSAAPAEQTLPVLNSAQVLSRIGGTEMRVGMHSEDFGSVSIATSVSPGSVVAQISLDHGALSRALAAHLPSMEEKLGTTLGLNARVELRDTAAPAGSQGSSHSFSGEGSGNGQGSRATASGSLGGYGRGQPVSANADTAANSTGVLPEGSTGSRLSIHV